MSSKGVNKKQNELRWERYESALEGRKDMATNRGFGMRNGAMYTYEQRKLGLSAYYDKRWVLPDGIHTEPIEFHTPAGGNWVPGGNPYVLILSSLFTVKPLLNCWALFWIQRWITWICLYIYICVHIFVLCIL